MAAFPAYIKFRALSLAQEQGSAVLAFTPERGRPSFRRAVSDVLIEQPIEIIFLTAAQRASFIAWFNADASAGAGEFDWVDLLTGQTVQAWFKEGRLGGLSMITNDFKVMSMPITIQFMRSAL